MLRHLLTLALFTICYSAQSQYKNDNVLYKTVYPQDFCKELEKTPGYVLLDVRSEGEFRDTSSFGLNIGHLDGAINIDIRNLPKRWRQLNAFKNDPIFVYCSHSQRSRRAAQLLVDSGFTRVYNLNGGMTAMYLLNPVQRACFEAMTKTENKYSVIAAPELCRKLAAKFSSVYLLDVRPDSAWNHVSANAKANAYGYLKGTKHIPLADLKNQLADIPKNKEIVVTDLFGNDAAQAGKTLKENGFDKVYVLIEGMDRWLNADKNDWGCTKDPYVSPVSYNIISAGEFSRIYPANKDGLILDIRSAEEFANTHKDAWRNIGHIKNAVNVPAVDIDKRMAELEPFKSRPVFIYAYGGGAETYVVANALSQKGFSKVYVLSGGLFNVRWTAANASGMTVLNEWTEGVPEENK